jgi:hypothetical protein
MRSKQLRTETRFFFSEGFIMAQGKLFKDAFIPNFGLAVVCEWLISISPRPEVLL